METREIIKLFIPVLGIVFGVFIKMSKNESFLDTKKYWLLFVIGGIALFLFRLFKYFK